MSFVSFLHGRNLTPVAVWAELIIFQHDCFKKSRKQILMHLCGIELSIEFETS